jgi:hypothetical protein
MSRSRNTADVFIEQDPLGRTYSGVNAPVGVPEREGDMWIVETTRTLPTENLQKMEVPPSPKMISKLTRNRVSVTRWKRKG